MANYINIGSTCATFDQEAGTLPSALLDSVYIINNSGVFLNSTSTPDSTGYSTASTSNVVKYSDLQFKVWFSQDLVRSGNNRQNWRYITAQTASSVPAYSTAAPTVYQTITLSTGSWPSGSITSSITNLTHPADSTTQTTFKIVIESDTDFNTAINNILAFPSINGTVIDDDTKLYLFQKNATTKFLKFTSSRTLSIADTADPAELGPAAELYLQRQINSGIDAKLVLSISSGSTVPYSRVERSYEIVISGSGVAGVDGTYTITTDQPSFGPVEDPSFPSNATVIKSATGKYLYWNGGTTISALSVKDYWTSGISSDGIKKGMQFWFRDQTYLRDYTALKPMMDWYKWSVVNNISIAPSTAGNTSNVVINAAGNTLNIDGTNPPTTEGWVFSNVQSPYYLIYVRQNAGQMSNVGYLSVGTGDSVTYNTGNPTLTPSNVWICNKCTPLAGQNYCETTSSAVAGGGTTGGGTTGGGTTSAYWGVSPSSDPIFGISVDSNYVYTTRSSYVMRYKKTDGTFDIFDNTISPSGTFDVKVDNTTNYLYVLSKPASTSIRSAIPRYNKITGESNPTTQTVINFGNVTKTIEGLKSNAIAIDSTSVYTVAANGRLYKFDRNTGAETFFPISSAESFEVSGPGLTYGIAVDSTNIYFTIGDSVRKISITTGSSEIFYNSPTPSATVKIVNGGTCYALAVDNSFLYVSYIDSAGATTGKVIRIKKSGSNLTEIFNTNFPNITTNTITVNFVPTGLAVDDTHMYIGGGNQVVRFNKTTGLQT